jgi:MFS family permease
MSFQPASSLRSRTFLSLVFAQILAAFNDQAIHASAMFFAIHKHFLTEAQAISWMPILFYAPWALFATLAGYLADRYSKRTSLVFWKWAEVGITFVTLIGFWVGQDHPVLGPALVLSTVFLMGTHSAFFVPAKYGVMPEILEPHLLSRGNGVLESTSFLSVILGTVSGGMLSFYFRGNETIIGVILFGLAVVGALASLLIEPMPAANPDRRFPTNPITPLVHSIRGLLRSRPLALAVVGIAFFTFVVSYMRATVYMLGESHNPKWTEFQTSLLVGTVALGIGLGSPLAGYFSGGKVELGLVPIGALGMIAFTLCAAFTLNWVPGLVLCIILIGFFTGFYIVPQYTLLQHRAPKTSKGDAIATSNFINVTGAILSSALFFVLVLGAHTVGVCPDLSKDPTWNPSWAVGRLHRLAYDHHGRPQRFMIYDQDNRLVKEVRPPRTGRSSEMGEEFALLPDDDTGPSTKYPVVDVLGSLREDQRGGLPVTFSSAMGMLGSPFGQGPFLAPSAQAVGDHPLLDAPLGSQVIVSRYELRGVEHYTIRPLGMALPAAYDNEGLPRYLFIGAAFLTLMTLVVLCFKMPDLFVRSLLWLRAQGRYRVQVRGLPGLPSDGPVILATNCVNFDDCMNVVASTDRYTRFVLLESNAASEAGPLLRYLARRTGLIAVPPNADEAAWGKALEKATRCLKAGNMVGLACLSGEAPLSQERFLGQLRERVAALILPAYCGRMTEGTDRRVRVAFGSVMKMDAPAEEIVQAIEALANGPAEDAPTDHH